MSKFKYLAKYKAPIVVIVAIAIALLVYFDHFHSENIQKKLFPNLVLSQVTAITIFGDNEEPTYLKRTNEAWKISSPVDDMADEGMISLLLDSLQGEDFAEIAKTSPEEVDIGDPEKDEFDFRPYFENAKSIKIISNSGTHELEISETQTPDGKIYVRADGRVFVASSDLQRWLEPDDNLWRQKRPFANVSDVSKIVKVKNLNSEEVTYSGDKLLSIMESLGRVLAKNIIDSRGPVFADIVQESPNVEIQIYNADKEQPKLARFYYMQNQDAYLHIEGEQKIYEINKDEIQEILDN